MSNKHLLAGSQDVFHMPYYAGLITDEMIQNIRKVDCFAQTHYVNLEIPKSLSFFTDRYVKQLYDFTSIDNSKTIVDVGFGWLSIAFAFSTSVNYCS